MLVDRNPICRVLDYEPGLALPVIGFRFKLEQASPVRARLPPARGWSKARTPTSRRPTAPTSSTPASSPPAPEEFRAWVAFDTEYLRNVAHLYAGYERVAPPAAPRAGADRSRQVE